MSPTIGKHDKIRHIVRIQQILRRWCKKAVPSDVPAGHVAICVGSSGKRFVVRATYLNHPDFKSLLFQAEEEYGFTNQGPLNLPCEESIFQETLRVVSRSDRGISGRFASPDTFISCGSAKSGPFQGFAEKSIC
ncbi:hypothetical protein NMG60_11019498 [Bertholletia excelsa]